MPTYQRPKQQHLQENNSVSESSPEPSEKQVSCAEEVDKVNGKFLKETIHSAGLRREEREVDILPGDRLSIGVSCQAK